MFIQVEYYLDLILWFQFCIIINSLVALFGRVLILLTYLMCSSCRKHLLVNISPSTASCLLEYQA